MQAKALESELFGGAEELVGRLTGDANDTLEDAEHEAFDISAYVREVDAGGHRGEQEVTKQKQSKAGRGGREQTKRKPVWLDEDDDNTTVNIATNNRLRKLRVTSGETQLSGALPLPFSTA